jgi:CheY-like chemotaxis protein
MSDMHTSPVRDIVENVLVLIVEDEPALCALAGDVVEAAGLHVVSAYDAKQAMALLESRSDIAAVFTDLQLRGSMDGLALAEAVRQRWPQIDLLVTSGTVTPQCHKLPAGSRYFSMPYDVEKVVEALQSIAGRARRHHPNGA